MQKFISVIIPVYNKEKYLSRCLDSVTGQTIFNQLEIIIIDDGSTDDSFTIMQEYQQKYSNIYIFKQSNVGVSATRNRGIDLSKGKYIAFIDADDFVAENMFEVLYKQATITEAEIAVCNVNIYNQINHKVSIMASIFNKDDILEKYDSFSLLTDTTIGWGICNKLYCASFIKANKLYFDEKISLAEDFLFNFHAFLKIKKVVFVNQYLYYYVKMVTTSLTRVPNPQLINDGLLLLDKYQALWNSYLINGVKVKSYKSILDALISLNILTKYYNCIVNEVIVQKDIKLLCDNLIIKYLSSNKILFEKCLTNRHKLKILCHRFGLYFLLYKSYYSVKNLSRK